MVLKRWAEANGLYCTVIIVIVHTIMFRVLGRGS